MVRSALHLPSHRELTGANMGYINQAPALKQMFDNIDARLRLLETAVRFTAPDVTTEPTYPRVADIIYDNTTDQMKYWNGTEWVVFADDYLGVPKIAFTSTWSGTGLTYTGTPQSGGEIRIARRWDEAATTATNFFKGDVAVVRLYNRPLTAAEISANYAAERGRFGV